MKELLIKIRLIIFIILLIFSNNQIKGIQTSITFYDNFEYDNILVNGYYLSENVPYSSIYVNTSMNAVYSGTKGLRLEGSFQQPGSEVIRAVNLSFDKAKILSFYVFMLSSLRWEFRVNILDKNGNEVNLSYGKAGPQWIDQSNYNVGVYFTYLNWKRVYRNIEFDLNEAINHQDSPHEEFKPTLVRSYKLIADIGYNAGCFDDIALSSALIPFAIHSNQTMCGNYTDLNPTIENISPPLHSENPSDPLIKPEHYPYVIGSIILFVYLVYNIRMRRLYRSNRNMQPKLYPEIKD